MNFKPLENLRDNLVVLDMQADILSAGIGHYWDSMKRGCRRQRLGINTDNLPIASYDCSVLRSSLYNTYNLCGSVYILVTVRERKSL